MGAVSLAEIKISQLARIPATGGDVLHAMKQSDTGYEGFGEAYFSWVANGIVKGWKRHTLMTMNIVVPVGQVRFVFYTNEHMYRVEEIGADRYMRITVPPGIWFGFQGLAEQQSLVLNIANIPHDQNEVERLALSEMKYDWS
jgi:dTDP-4-dehydrorhamnose 3,5-epimerase